MIYIDVPEVLENNRKVLSVYQRALQGYEYEQVNVLPKTVKDLTFGAKVLRQRKRERELVSPNSKSSDIFSDSSVKHILRPDCHLDMGLSY